MKERFVKLDGCSIRIPRWTGVVRNPLGIDPEQLTNEIVLVPIGKGVKDNGEIYVVWSKESVS